MENLGKFTASILMIALTSIVSGAMIQLFWEWFVSTTFDLKELRLVEAIGILLLIKFITFKRDKTDEKTDYWDEFPKRIGYYFAFITMSWITGYIIHLFI